VDKIDHLTKLYHESCYEQEDIQDKLEIVIFSNKKSTSSVLLNIMLESYMALMSWD
jgi:hypothetical protein